MSRDDRRVRITEVGPRDGLQNEAAINLVNFISMSKLIENEVFNVLCKDPTFLIWDVAG